MNLKLNLSIYYSRTNDVNKAMMILDNLIIFIKNRKSFILLPYIYYQKSMYHYKLNEFEEYFKYLQYSKILCETFGYDELLDNINDKVNKFIENK